MNFFASIPLQIVLALTLVMPASAQSDQDFVNAFSGEWYVFDASARDGENICNLTLSDKPVDDAYNLSKKGCAAPISNADRWRISAGQIFLSTDQADIAILGGNQFRVTGEIQETGSSLVVERAQGDGNSAKIANSLRKHKCYFVGFSQQCATGSDLSIPKDEGEASLTTIEVLANLNARSQPRRDAPALGTIAQGTRIEVAECLTASDGPWCKAVLGDNLVWLAMTAIRLEEWPIITYRLSGPSQ